MRNGGFCLDGKFTWFLIRDDEVDEHWVVVLPKSEGVQREDLVREIMCIEFAFGTSFRLDHLIGLDPQRTIVAARSVGHLVRHTYKHRAPVPDDVGGSDVWPPEFFRLLSSKLHAEGLEPLLIAIGAYLDAEVDHLDGGYLKAQVGLEAFAKRLLPASSAELLVQDAAEWRQWIAKLDIEIGRRTRDSKGAEIIRNKFTAAMYAPTGELVSKALSARGVALPQDVVNEIKKRNYSVHGFLMNAGLERDLDEDVRRLEMVQTLLAALVAGHIGYAGPLTGYDVTEDGERPSPSWWPVGISDADTHRRCVCARDVRASDTRNEVTNSAAIAERAYFLWVERGCAHGADLDDWLLAERELATSKAASVA